MKINVYNTLYFFLDSRWQVWTSLNKFQNLNKFEQVSTFWTSLNTYEHVWKLLTYLAVLWLVLIVGFESIFSITYFLCNSVDFYPLNTFSKFSTDWKYLEKIWTCLNWFWTNFEHFWTLLIDQSVELLKLNQVSLLRCAKNIFGIFSKPRTS